MPRIPSTWAQRASDLLRKASPTAKASPKAAVAPCHAAGSRSGRFGFPEGRCRPPGRRGMLPGSGAEDNFFRICESHRLARDAFSPQNAEESRQKPRRCAAMTRISGKNCRNHACPCADARRNLSKPVETAVKTAPKPAETRPAAPKPSETVQPLAVPPYRRTAVPPNHAEARRKPCPATPFAPRRTGCRRALCRFRPLGASVPCNPAHREQALFVHMRGSALTSRRQFIGAARHIYPPTGINFL